MSQKLSPQLASRFAAIALGHVTREYPNKLDHVLAGPEDIQGPRALHPIFYGSFDWHSCVHGYWLLASLYLRFPEFAGRDRIRDHFAGQLVPDKVEGEVAYLSGPDSMAFERPYGWAWLLMLAAELTRNTTEEGRRWSEAMRPLAEAISCRFLGFLQNAPYPNRSGAHTNTAFALTLASEYAAVANHTDLAQAIADRAQAWYGQDVDCQAWEPDNDAFLSPALIEAECMRRALPPEEFSRWIALFLPGIAQEQPATLFAPAVVSNRSDCKIVHLDGLNLSRAWCWRSISPSLEEPSRQIAGAAAERHLDCSLPQIAGDYVGEHWLASFALLALIAFEQEVTP
jgi:hypothetical protein